MTAGELGAVILIIAGCVLILKLVRARRETGPVPRGLPIPPPDPIEWLENVECYDLVDPFVVHIEASKEMLSRIKALEKTTD